MTELQPVPEDWERALAVVAHPDDLEYGSAAAIARWTAQGKHIVYALATSGEAGIDSMEPEQTRTVREAEERESARIVGVDTVEFLGYQDGVVEYGLPLRRDLTAAIRRHRPEVVLTINFRETFGPGMLNQSDHVAVGRALIDAIRDAGNRWVFTDLGLDPWDGVRFALANGSPDATHAVDVTDALDRGTESLKAHAAYLQALGPAMSEPWTFLETFAVDTGERFGCKYAIAFEFFNFKPFG